MSKKPRNEWRCVKCPFFHADEAGMMKAIYCEGTAKNTNVRQTFDTNESLKKWEDKYCKDIRNYHACPLFKLVIAKYEN